MNQGIANTPLVNYFRYKQTTTVSGQIDNQCHPILSIADGGNGQLVITTNDTSLLDAGTAVNINSTTSYDGNYTVISLTPTTFNVSGQFVGSETGCWELDNTSIAANAGDPLDFGTIEFYNATNTTTLQDTYQDRDLTVLNPNPITLSAVGSYPPIYLLDIPYFIVIRDKFNNIVATLDNYLPTNLNGIITATPPLGNIFPSYGFDFKFNPNIYEFQTIPASGGAPVGGGWFWETDTTEPDPVNLFRYETLGNSGIIGNPKNELIVRSTNNSSGQTVNDLNVIIGDYNYFQGQQLAFSIFARTINTLDTTLTVQLFRFRNGANETPIAIGTINLTSTRTQSTIVFTVPPLTTSDYQNSDALFFRIVFPLNEDFEYGFTATWLQLSPDGTIAITEDGVSVNAAKQFFNRGFREYQQNEPSIIRGLPLTIGSLNEANVIPLTGSIFLGSPSATSQYSGFAGSMIGEGDDDFGAELVRNEVIGSGQTNRLIDFLRNNGLTQSRLSFIAQANDGPSPFVTVQLGIGARQISAFISFATPRITVQKNTDELQFALEALTLGNGRIRFTFRDNFETNPEAYNPLYVNSNQPAFTILPVQAPIVSWFGEAWFSVFLPVALEIGLNFYNRLDFNTTSIGSPTSPAQVDFTLRNNQTVVQKFDGENNLFSINNIVFNNIMSRDGYTASDLYRGFSNIRRGYIDQEGPVLSDFTFFGINYFAYNDITDNPAQQPANPPRVIRYTGNAPTGTISTLTIDDISRDTSSSQMAAITSERVNTSWEWQININSTPQNGDVVQVANGRTVYNLIFFDTAQSRPPNPSSIVKAIYVEYQTSQTLLQIAQATQNALERGVMGIPRAADLGLDFNRVIGTTSFQYFMNY